MQDYKMLLEEFKELLKQKFQPGDVIWNNKNLSEETVEYIPTTVFKTIGLYSAEDQVNERKKIIQDFFNMHLGKKQKIKENSNQIIASFLQELTLQNYLEIEEPKNNNGLGLNGYNKNFVYKCCLSLFLTNVVKNEIFFAREFNNEKTKNFSKL